MLDEIDKTILLKLARMTLETYLSEHRIPDYHSSREALLERKGAFVSLHMGEELRGCIGLLVPEKELYKVVQHCVLSAALEDTRFIPVAQSEVNSLSIEISVLTPFCRIQNVEEIEVGKHGLYIVKEGYRGLLLPQVASQYNWNRTQFLEHTCMKAGLRESAWRDAHTAIHTFEADVFSDSPVHGLNTSG